jgi:hypothetical protein
MPVHVRVKVVLESMGGVLTDPDGNVGVKLKPPPEMVHPVELASE